ncbi:MAG: class I SAM-dependent methyltransferase [Pseudomonadota bacterium]
MRRLQRSIEHRRSPSGAFLPVRHLGDPLIDAPALVAPFDAAQPAMLDLLDRIDAHDADLGRFGGPAPAPRFEQAWFPGLDAAAAYALVRHRRPQRIVEIGSGHSTRVLARAIADGGLATEFVAIDPAPRAPLLDLDVRWQRHPVQGSGEALVAALEPGDVLFVDSSHVLVAGSDVAWIWLRLLPLVRPGVLVHVHDVFLPDAYPAAWTWRGYNEQAAVLPLLLGGWTILFASRFLRRHRRALLAGRTAERLPLLPGVDETSLWLCRD